MFKPGFFKYIGPGSKNMDFFKYPENPHVSIRKGVLKRSSVQPMTCVLFAEFVTILER